jgi:hypothetical protein
MCALDKLERVLFKYKNVLVIKEAVNRCRQVSGLSLSSHIWAVIVHPSAPPPPPPIQRSLSPTAVLFTKRRRKNSDFYSPP